MEIPDYIYCWAGYLQAAFDRGTSNGEIVQTLSHDIFLIARDDKHSLPRAVGYAKFFTANPEKKEGE